MPPPSSPSLPQTSVAVHVRRTDLIDPLHAGVTASLWVIVTAEQASVAVAVALRIAGIAAVPFVTLGDPCHHGFSHLDLVPDFGHHLPVRGKEKVHP